MALPMLPSPITAIVVRSEDPVPAMIRPVPPCPAPIAAPQYTDAATGLQIKMGDTQRFQPISLPPWVTMPASTIVCPEQADQAKQGEDACNSGFRRTR